MSDLDTFIANFLTAVDFQEAVELRARHQVRRADGVGFAGGARRDRHVRHGIRPHHHRRRPQGLPDAAGPVRPDPIAEKVGRHDYREHPQCALPRPCLVRAEDRHFEPRLSRRDQIGARAPRSQHRHRAPPHLLSVAVFFRPRGGGGRETSRRTRLEARRSRRADRRHAIARLSDPGDRDHHPGPAQAAHFDPRPSTSTWAAPATRTAFM